MLVGYPENDDGRPFGRRCHYYSRITLRSQSAFLCGLLRRLTLELKAVLSRIDGRPSGRRESLPRSILRPSEVSNSRWIILRSGRAPYDGGS